MREVSGLHQAYQACRFRILPILCLAVLLASSALGQGQSPELDRLSQRIVELAEAGAYDEAVKAAEQCLQANGEHFGQESVEYATALLRKANLLLHVRHIADAGTLLDRALAIYRQRLDYNDLRIAVALNNLGLQRHWVGHFEEAARL